MLKYTLFIPLIFISSLAGAADKEKKPFQPKAYDLPEVVLKGKIDTAFGFVKQQSDYRYIYKDATKTAEKHSQAIVTSTDLSVEIRAKSKYGFEYGGKISLNTDTSLNDASNDDKVADKTMIYIEGKLGKLEGGANDSATQQMLVSANSIAKGTGGIDGKIPKWFGKGPKIIASIPSQDQGEGENNDAEAEIAWGDFGQRYIVYPEAPIDEDLISHANKITYFTPKYNGLQLGFSYTPDTEIHGSLSKYHIVGRNIGQGFNNLFDYAITYENKLNQLEYKIGFNGEIGKAKKGPVARKNLNVWELGTVLTYKEFSIAGSFSQWGKSATPVVKDPNKKYGAKYWTAGVAYDKDGFGVSLTYFKSYLANVYTAQAPTVIAQHDTAHNKLQYLILSTEYKVVEGLLPYAELGRFKADDSARAGNKGYVLLTGVKLTF